MKKHSLVENTIPGGTEVKVHSLPDLKTFGLKNRSDPNKIEDLNNLIFLEVL